MVPWVCIQTKISRDLLSHGIFLNQWLLISAVAAAEAAPIDESPADDNSTKTDKSDEPEVKSRDDQK